MSWAQKTTNPLGVLKAAGNEKGAALVAGSLQIVSNVSVLREIKPSLTRKVRTMGVISAGDCGGGDWYAVTGGSVGQYIDDIGSTVVPNGGDGSSAWVRKYSDSVTVADFGSVGVGDESSKWEAAINYARDNGLKVKVKYIAGGYTLGNVRLPENNVHLSGEASTGKRVIINHNSDTGIMFDLSSPSEQTHHIVFENFEMRATAGATTSQGIYIDPTYVSFGIKLTNCYFDGFSVANNIENCFWSRFERLSYDNCMVGFYGASDIDNEFINCVPRTIPDGGIGLWILGHKTWVVSGDTGSADSGINAIQYRVGNDVNALGFANITAKQYTASVVFNGTHFEFSDMAGLGTVQESFVDIRAGSVADFNQCHFMNRTPGLLNAVKYQYLTKLSKFINCVFAEGPANVAAGNGSYVNHINVISKSYEGRVTIEPEGLAAFNIAGITAKTGLSIKVPAACRVSPMSVQTVLNGANDQVLLSVKQYDVLNEFITNSYVATYQGLYEIKVALNLGGTNAPVAGAKYRAEIRVNGVAKSRFDKTAHDGDSMTLPVEDDLYLESGDIVTVFLSNTSGASVDIASNSTMTYVIIKKAV